MKKIIHGAPDQPPGAPNTLAMQQTCQMLLDIITSLRRENDLVWELIGKPGVEDAQAQ